MASQRAFLAGGEFPYPIVQPGGAGSVPTVTVQFRPYGVKLEFTPFVNSDGTIRLKVAPEVSALDYTNEVVIAGYTLPALSTRQAETEVELKDGQSFGISGILDHRTTDSLSKIPGIGDIPVLGQLFRSKNLNHSTMELVVIVTPKIIDTLSGAALPPSDTGHASTVPGVATIRPQFAEELSNHVLLQFHIGENDVNTEDDKARGRPVRRHFVRRRATADVVRQAVARKNGMFAGTMPESTRDAKAILCCWRSCSGPRSRSA